MFIGGRSSQWGSPHLVIFVEDITNINLPLIGPLLECHPLFPNRTNVEFVQVLNRDEVRMKVWERGSGITQACGTGACATAVAGTIQKKQDEKPWLSWMEGLSPSVGTRVPTMSI